MIIYNVTTKVTWAIEKDWVTWMQQTHMAEMVATGCFLSHTLVKLLDIDDTEGPTYAAQYVADSKEKIDEYIDVHSTALREAGLSKWGDQFISFRTLMQVVE